MGKNTWKSAKQIFKKLFEGTNIMAFKINISKKDGKTFKLEIDTEAIIGKKLGETIEGEELKAELAGYQLEIVGMSDKAGFPSLKEVEGIGLRRVLLTKGKGMKDPRSGVRLRKTIRGNTISKDIIQINTKVVKEGSKKLEEIFPEQNKPKEPKPVAAPAAA